MGIQLKDRYISGKKLVEVFAQSFIVSLPIQLVIKIKQVHIDQRTGQGVVHNMTAQHLHCLFALAQRHKKISLLLDINQLFSFNRSCNVRHAHRKILR